MLRRQVRSIEGLELPVHVVCDYTGDGKTLVGAVKFRGRRSVARWFGEHLTDMIDSQQIEMVTWIPSSKRGKRQRGFDSGRLLAEQLAQCAGIPAVRTLRRVGNSRQGGRDRSQRANGPDLELVRKAPLSRCLLVDDVCTTGASLRSGVMALDDRVVALAVAASAPMEMEMFR